MPPARLVICKCSNCILNTYTNNNSQTQQGSYVTNRTRQKHLATGLQEAQGSLSARMSDLNVEDEDNDDDTDEPNESEASTADSKSDDDNAETLVEGKSCLF